MSRQNPPAKWVLPEAVDPPTTRCFVIEVPDDPQHVAAFRGALLNLASAYKWADDVTHMAKDVALRWRQAIDEMGECDSVIMLRTNPFDPCGAQVSYDGGVVWVEFFNARQCAVDTARDVLGGQTPPGGASPTPGQCFDLDLVINGNSMKVIPLAVASGWTLKISQLGGAWWDGNLANYWQCADGHQFALGTCTGNFLAGLPGDPIPSSNHMRLILQLANGTYAAIPLDGTPYIVPAGQPSGNYFLMSNDSTLADNQGSISLHLNACNAGWCYEFDFTQAQHGFLGGLENGVGAVGSSWSVNGWAGDCYQSGSDWYGATQAYKTFSSGDIVRVEMDYFGTPGTYDFGNNNTYIYINGNYLGAGALGSGNQTKVVDNINLTTTALAFSAGYNNGNGSNHNCNTGAALVKKIRVYGTGTSPFGPSNC